MRSCNTELARDNTEKYNFLKTNNNNHKNNNVLVLSRTVIICKCSKILFQNNLLRTFRKGCISEDGLGSQISETTIFREIVLLPENFNTFSFYFVLV